MAEVTLERVAMMATAARTACRRLAARIAKAVAPVVARMAQGDIAIEFEIEPATYPMIARGRQSAGEAVSDPALLSLAETADGDPRAQDVIGRGDAGAARRGSSNGSRT